MLSPIENVSPTKTINMSAPSIADDQSKYEHVLMHMNEEFQKLA